MTDDGTERPTTLLDEAKAPYGGTFPKIEAGRADLVELAMRGANEMVAADDLAAKKRERDGTPERQTESYGVLVRDLPNGWHAGEVIGMLPGADRETKVYARTRDGVIAMCHRAYLQALTAGNVCDAKTARIRASEAVFYVSLIV